MITLSKLRFKKNAGGMLAVNSFGTMFVSVGYTPGWNGNPGSYYGDGRTTWEVAFGVIGDENFKLIQYAHRQQINTILKNISLKGRMGAAV